MVTPSIDELKAGVRGKVILPGDADYDTARKVYNGMIDKRPALIVRCADIADVINSVNYARENKLLTAIRGGGHNGAGLGVCDDGMVIDLSLMRSVHIDPVLKTVRAGGGCLLSDLDHATHAFGLAVPSGLFSTTGIGGLALGGGLGHLTRAYGLTIDNLLEADVVLADGSYVKASPDEHTDLFWAIRGGGGNFGVVVSFLFRAHPVNIVYGGPMLWEMKDAKTMMQWYRRFIVEAPKNVSCFLALMTVPPAPPFPEELRLKKVCGIVWCCNSSEEEAGKAFQSARDLKAPILDWAGPLPFPVLQSLFDAAAPPGLQHYWKGDYVNELSDEAIDLHLRHAQHFPTWQSAMHLYPINGAASDIGRQDTAWNYRTANWATVIMGVGEDPSANDLNISWAKNYFQDLQPYCAGGAYVNFMMEEGMERVKASYGENYDRLAKIKTKYDPHNLFRVNQNIKPLVEALT